jgi:hypothetical protein
MRASGPLKRVVRRPTVCDGDFEAGHTLPNEYFAKVLDLEMPAE